MRVTSEDRRTKEEDPVSEGEKSVRSKMDEGTEPSPW